MLQAPFPYFGGKSAVAYIVWQALGDVGHYIEPFFGSGAVLLQRPNYDPTRHVETINDKDCYIANVWRSLQFSPDETARWCDWPINHVDLTARKAKLVEKEEYLCEGLASDPEWHDPKLAGYWIWAASCWIGAGLTSSGQRPHLGTTGMGVHKVGKIPRLADTGVGIHKLGQRPHLTGTGMGIHKLGGRPHLTDTGMGVHKLGKRPHLADTGVGVHKISLIDGSEPDRDVDVREPYNLNIYRWFRALSERLRYVRVVCGDWKRVCGGNWQDQVKGICGIFFDPPYGVSDRDTDIYHHDNITIAQEVKEWCRERGKKESYRIVIAGYEEYEDLLKDGWTVYRWKANGGYANISKNHTQGKNNRHRECLYFSPHCLNMKSLFQLI